MTSPVSDAMIEAGVSALKMERNACPTDESIARKVYLAMKAVEQSSDHSPDDVERVTKAIEQVDIETRGVDQLPVDWLYREMARAALSAIKGQLSTVDEVERPNWNFIEYGYEKIAIQDERGTEIGFVHRRRDAEIIRDALSAIKGQLSTIDERWSDNLNNAPHACHVMAARFDDSFGEWIYGIVMSPPIKPFTHWRILPEPPAIRNGDER